MRIFEEFGPKTNHPTFIKYLHDLGLKRSSPSWGRIFLATSLKPVLGEASREIRQSATEIYILIVFVFLVSPSSFLYSSFPYLVVNAANITMTTRRRNNRNRRRAAVSTSILPLTCTPPVDPPSVAIDRVHIQTITDTHDVTKDVTSTHNNISLVGRIRLQAFSGATVDFHYQVIMVACWAAGQDQCTLALQDNASRRLWEDSGSFSQRARVGYRFDPPGQMVRSSDDASADIYNLLCNKTTQVESHVKVRFWSGSSDVLRASTRRTFLCFNN